MSNPVVLITSATGRIGRELVARLAQGNQFTIRACYNKPENIENLTALGAGQLVHFDLTDNKTWDMGRRRRRELYN